MIDDLSQSVSPVTVSLSFATAADIAGADLRYRSDRFAQQRADVGEALAAARARVHEMGVVLHCP